MFTAPVNRPSLFTGAALTRLSVTLQPIRDQDSAPITIREHIYILHLCLCIFLLITYNTKTQIDLFINLIMIMSVFFFCLCVWVHQCIA